MTDIAAHQVPPLASFLAEEMEVRGWTAVDVAIRMPGDYGINVGMVNLLLAVQDEKMIVSEAFAGSLAAAFGVDANLFLNLHRQWLCAPPEAREGFECPEHLLDGILIPANDVGSA